MTLGPAKSGNLRKVISHNVILTNQKTKFFMYHRLRANATFDKMFFPAFCEASDIISCVLLMHYL